MFIHLHSISKVGYLVAGSKALKKFFLDLKKQKTSDLLQKSNFFFIVLEEA